MWFRVWRMEFLFLRTSTNKFTAYRSRPAVVNSLYIRPAEVAMAGKGGEKRQTTTDDRRRTFRARRRTKDERRSTSSDDFSCTTLCQSGGATTLAITTCVGAGCTRDVSI